jgi:hypothetical protein
MSYESKNQEVFHIGSKSMTTLFQGAEDDEPKSHQIIQYGSCKEKQDEVYSSINRFSFASQANILRR